MFATVALALLTLGQSASAALPEETLALARIKAGMAANLERLPNFICKVHLEREERLASAKAFAAKDAFDLEVAVAGNRELFGKPGGRMSEDSILQLVGPGLSSTGDFALFARSIFATRAPVFRFEGEEPIGGRHALRYGYQVSEFISGYTVHMGGSVAVVAYYGQFWADAVSNEVLKMTVVATDLPPSLGVRSIARAIAFRKWRIGSNFHLLPAESEVEVERNDGAAARNRLRFSDCRLFTVESSISFEVKDPK